MATGLPKPDGIPDNWIERDTDTHGGREYINPDNPNDRVRVMPGDPHSLYPSQRQPYVIDQHGGYRDVNGNLIPGSGPRPGGAYPVRALRVSEIDVELTAHESVASQLRRWWFCRVSELSDIGLQRRTWLDIANRNPHWSYIEFIESYPDHDQLLDALKQGWLTAAEFEILSELGRILDSHTAPAGNHYDNAAVLDDPAWHSVVKAAERARQQLLSMTTDQDEREMLLGTA